MCFKCRTVYHLNCVNADPVQKIWICCNCEKVDTTDKKEEIITVLLEELQLLKAENDKLSHKTQRSKCEIQDERNTWHQAKKSAKNLVSQQLSCVKTSNRFSILDDKSIESKESSRVTEKVNVPKNRPKRQPMCLITKKILLLSDSHGRNCASLLNDFIKPKYCATSVIKPNACFSSVIQGASKLARDFKRDDVVVILAGTNDIRIKNNFIPVLEKSIAAMDHTNILLCTVPYCYDRPEFNERVYKVNKYIMNMSSKLANVKVIDVNAFLERTDYTNRGLHLNKRGKSTLCRNVATSITNPWKQCEVIKTLTTCSVKKVTFCATETTPSKTTQGTNVTARNGVTSVSQPNTVTSKRNSATEATACEGSQGNNVNTRNISVLQPNTFRSIQNSISSACVMGAPSIASSSAVISSVSPSPKISTPYVEASSKGPKPCKNSSAAECSRENAVLRSSTRARRVPMRSSDFLWPALGQHHHRQQVKKVQTVT